MRPLARTTNLRARVEIALWRHGWAGLLAAVVALAALALHVGALVPTQAALQSAQADLAREQKLALALPAVTAAAPLSEQQQLAALQALLRQSPETGELVRKMAALAQAEQIVLAQSDYQQQYNSTTQLLQVQITQPVKAGYPQLRRYIEAVLRALPNASLDQITARRDNVGQAQVEARLKWSIWLPAAAVSPRARPAGEATP